jgi:uncharacterized protein YcfL
MKTKYLLPVACVAAALFAAGCSTPVNSVENAQKEGRRAMISDQRVISDPGLSHHVGVVGVNTAMTDGGLLRVQVELLNETGSLHRFSYKFEWFDANGMQVENILSAASTDQIEGKESKMISSIAPNPGCKDFRLKLISAD